MPQHLPSYCTAPGCRQVVRGKRYCEQHQKAKWKEDAAGRRDETRFYDSTAWRKLRKSFLQRHPVCCVPRCNKPATVVDHILARAQGGDPFDETNLQGMCDKHHQQKRGTESRGSK